MEVSACRRQDITCATRTSPRCLVVRRDAVSCPLPVSDTYLAVLVAATNVHFRGRGSASKSSVPGPCSANDVTQISHYSECLWQTRRHCLAQAGSRQKTFRTGTRAEPIDEPQNSVERFSPTAKAPKGIPPRCCWQRGGTGTGSRPQKKSLTKNSVKKFSQINSPARTTPSS